MEKIKQMLCGLGFDSMCNPEDTNATQKNPGESSRQVCGSVTSVLFTKFIKNKDGDSSLELVQHGPDEKTISSRDYFEQKLPPNLIMDPKGDTVGSGRISWSTLPKKFVKAAILYDPPIRRVPYWRGWSGNLESMDGNLRYLLVIPPEAYLLQNIDPKNTTQPDQK